jgi:hypothetical protein
MAGSLEWWAIPVADLDRFADNGQTPDDEVIITRHHGKRRPMSLYDPFTQGGP